jgi:hypothetical protein
LVRGAGSPESRSSSMMLEADAAEGQIASWPPSPSSSGTRIRPTGMLVPVVSRMPWKVQAAPGRPPNAGWISELGELATTASNRCG